METKCNSETKTVKTCNLDSRTPILHPVVLGAPETSISLDTETASLSNSDSDSDTDCHQNSVLPIGDSGLGQISTINVENSTDVVIGPLTQFHGPVTIYQTVNTNTQNNNGMLENHKAEESDSSSKCGQKNIAVTKRLQLPKKITWIFKWILLMCLILTVVGVIVSLTTSLKSYVPLEDSNLLLGSNSPVIPYNFTFRMYTRKEWFGKDPLNFTKPLAHPTSYVIVSHTDGSSCTDFLSCSAKLRNIQTYHMQGRLEPDVGYNFLIGGDAAVYMGRGWDLVNFHKNNTIDVSVIGDYTLHKLTPQMILALEDLLDMGVKLYKLAADYKIVCHNQTTPTLSPGENACSVVARLPHYFPGSVSL